MNIAHCIGPAEIEQIVVAAHLAVPGVEASASIPFLIELQRLDHRSHGAVEHEDALFQESKEFGSYALVGHGDSYHPFALRSDILCPWEREGVTARRPSRWQIAKTRSARFIV